MNNIWSTALQLIVGFALGNFVYQYIQETPNWGLFLERSFFQTFAFLAFAFYLSTK